MLKLAKNMRKLAFWNLSVFLSILSGRSAEMVFEAAAEIKGIGKAAAFGYLRDGDVCFQQQIPRIFQPQSENILLGRCSGAMAQMVLGSGVLIKNTMGAAG